MFKVFINPGHAPGIDPGAINYRYNISEADFCLEIGNAVAEYLQAAGCDVLLLQSDNLAGEGVGENVCETANSWGADLFISLHCNAFNGVATGTEVFTSPGQTMADFAATSILEQIQQTFPSLLVRADYSDGDVDKEANFIVLKHTEMPAVLVEMFFIDNDNDLQLMLDNKDALARAIARGVTDYISVI